MIRLRIGRLWRLGHSMRRRVCVVYGGFDAESLGNGC